AQAAYMNLAHRWNWGLAGGQIPYVSGAVQTGIAPVNGQSALVEQRVLFRQTERSGAGIVSYPFDRSRRVEFQGGATRISFDQTVQTQAFSLSTGQQFLDTTETTSIGTPLTLGTSSVAYVFDTSNFGATSPVNGQRYRLETAPTFGS